MVRMRSLLLPAFLAFTAAVLPPNASIGQDAGFGRDADVHVREDSFACKETSELDRLLQRNQSGGFTSGVQLYEYLQVITASDYLQDACACTRHTGSTFAFTIRNARISP